MFIKSLEFQNILSFGPKQKLNGFNSMNLFIGKNGSGKSNTMRLIGDLSFLYRRIDGAIDIKTGNYIRKVKAYNVKLDHEFVCNRVPNRMGNVGDLKICYTRNSRSGNEEDSLLEFQNGELVCGDVQDLNRRGIKSVNSDWSDADFVNSFAREGDDFQTNAILIFGLRYIFQRFYSVFPNGMLDEGHTRQGEHYTGGGGLVRFNKDLWPDGVLRVAKVIQQIAPYGGVVLMEEPELGLEPRAVRRFFDFLCW
ncbi:MAG: hypothetical protein ABJL72_01770 [Roseobacter sp.]